MLRKSIDILILKLIITLSQAPEQKKRGGWPKGKRRKNVPNVNAPKAPLTGSVH